MMQEKINTPVDSYDDLITRVAPILIHHDYVRQSFVLYKTVNNQYGFLYLDKTEPFSTHKLSQDINPDWSKSLKDAKHKIGYSRQQFADLLAISPEQRTKATLSNSEHFRQACWIRLVKEHE